MRVIRTAIPLCLAARLAGPALAAAPAGGPPGLEIRSGSVVAMDWGDRRVTLLGTAGRFDLGFDRNTVVYLMGRLGTLRDLLPGVEVRAGVGQDEVAAWIEIRRPPPDGGATGPGDGGATARRGGGSPGGADGGTPGAGGGGDGGAPR